MRRTYLIQAFVCVGLALNALQVARADTTCGGGKLQGLVGGTPQCISCGNAAALAAASGYATGCLALANAGASYCTAADSDGQCNECPAGTHASGVEAAQIDDCVCDAGTFGVHGNCTLCTVGHYCPGAGSQVLCPGGYITEPQDGQVSASACQAPLCGNGKHEVGEECDDGAQYSGDGCSGGCQLEGTDAGGAAWYCYSDDAADVFSKTSCCTARVNPVTTETTCSCEGQSTDYVGYRVLSTCEKQDIDECAINHGGCAPQAACSNLDGLQKNGTHVCKCPSPMMGDGAVRCDMFVFATHVEFELVGLAVADLNLQVIYTHAPAKEEADQRRLRSID